MEIILHVPSDERSRVLQTALDAKETVEVVVREGLGATTWIGVAGLRTHHETSGPSELAYILDFDPQPVMTALVALANARFVPQSELLIVARGKAPVRYPFSRGETGEADLIR